MLITLSRRTAICQSVAEVQLTGVFPLGAVSTYIYVCVCVCVQVCNILGVDRRTISEWTLKRQVSMRGIGLIRLRIGIIGMGYISPIASLKTPAVSSRALLMVQEVVAVVIVVVVVVVVVSKDRRIGTKLLSFGLPSIFQQSLLCLITLCLTDGTLIDIVCQSQ